MILRVSESDRRRQTNRQLESEVDRDAGDSLRRLSEAGLRAMEGDKRGGWAKDTVGKVADICVGCMIVIDFNLILFYLRNINLFLGKCASLYKSRD